MEYTNQNTLSQYVNSSTDTLASMFGLNIDVFTKSHRFTVGRKIHVIKFESYRAFVPLYSNPEIVETIVGYTILNLVTLVDDSVDIAFSATKVYFFNSTPDTLV